MSPIHLIHAGDYNNRSGLVESRVGAGDYSLSNQSPIAIMSRLSFDSTYLNPQNTGYHGGGFAIRCLAR